MVLPLLVFGLLCPLLLCPITMEKAFKVLLRLPANCVWLGTTPEGRGALSLWAWTVGVWRLGVVAVVAGTGAIYSHVYELQVDEAAAASLAVGMLGGWLVTRLLVWTYRLVVRRATVETRRRCRWLACCCECLAPDDEGVRRPYGVLHDEGDGSASSQHGEDGHGSSSTHDGSTPSKQSDRAADDDGDAATLASLYLDGHGRPRRESAISRQLAARFAAGTRNGSAARRARGATTDSPGLRGRSASLGSAGFELSAKRTSRNARHTNAAQRRSSALRRRRTSS